MQSTGFDLLYVVQTIRERKRFILILTLATVVLGGLVFLVRKPYFKATAQLLVSNPRFMDRGNIFRNTDATLDYFADEDDVDRAIAIAGSRSVMEQIMLKSGMISSPNFRTEDPKEYDKIYRAFNSNYDVTRNEYNMLEVSFTDVYAPKAAEIANEAAAIVEANYRKYYSIEMESIYTGLREKISGMDSAIAVLTDSLASLRNYYKIYDIIAPDRTTMISSSPRTGAGTDAGRGIEVIQNVEAVKDALVIQRSRSAAVLNEFGTSYGIKGSRFMQVISPAAQPIKPTGLGLVLTLVAAAIAGFGMALLISLVQGYLRLKGVMRTK